MNELQRNYTKPPVDYDLLRRSKEAQIVANETSQHLLRVLAVNDRLLVKARALFQQAVDRTKEPTKAG